MAVSQAEFYSAGLQTLKETRAEELPTYFEPQRISLLFQKQSEKWEEITQEFLNEFYNKCEIFLVHALRLEFRKEPDVPTRLWQSFLGDNFAERKSKAEDELRKLLDDRKRPVKTQSSEFSEKTRNMRSARIFGRFNNAVKEHLQGDSESVMDSDSVSKSHGLFTSAQHGQSEAARFQDDMLSYYIVSSLDTY